MKLSNLFAVLSAGLLFGAATLSFAVSPAQDPSDDSATVRKAKEPSKKPNAKIEAKKKEAAKIKLVDINGAASEELMRLPGIGDAEAAKIIAGRPYGSKAHLLTRNILSNEVYGNIKKLVMAKQPYKDAAQNAALYAPKTKSKK